MVDIPKVGASPPQPTPPPSAPIQSPTAPTAGVAASQGGWIAKGVEGSVSVLENGKWHLADKQNAHDQELVKAAEYQDHVWVQGHDAGGAVKWETRRTTPEGASVVETRASDGTTSTKFTWPDGKTLTKSVGPDGVARFDFRHGQINLTWHDGFRYDAAQKKWVGSDEGKPAEVKELPNGAVVFKFSEKGTTYQVKCRPDAFTVQQEDTADKRTYYTLAKDGSIGNKETLAKHTDPGGKTYWEGTGSNGVAVHEHEEPDGTKVTLLTAGNGARQRLTVRPDGVTTSEKLEAALWDGKGRIPGDDVAKYGYRPVIRSNVVWNSRIQYYSLASLPGVPADDKPAVFVNRNGEHCTLPPGGPLEGAYGKTTSKADTTPVK